MQPATFIPCWDEVITDIVAWKRTADDLRRFWDIFIYWCRKNAKTSTMCVIMLGLITIEGKFGKQVYVQGQDSQAATYMAKICKRMIEQSHENAVQQGRPELDMTEKGPNGAWYRFDKTDAGLDIIEHIASGCQIIFMSNRSGQKIGKNPYAVFIDEIQEQADFENIMAYMTGMGAQDEFLFFKFGTAGKKIEKENAPWRIELDKARRCAKNPDLIPDYYPSVFETLPDENPHDPEVWKKCNPAWGYTINLVSFTRIYETAKETPEQWARFLQYNLNMIVPATSVYMPVARYDECKVDTEKWTLESLFGRECFFGLDLAHTHDMVALALIFPFWNMEECEIICEETKEGKYEMILTPTIFNLVYYFIPEAAIDSATGELYDYRHWVEQGWVELCGKNTINFALLRRRAKTILKPFKVIEGGYDPYAASEMITHMSGEKNADPPGDGFTMVPVPQRPGVLSAPTNRVRDLVLDHHWQHIGNPVQRWNITNSRTITDKSGNIMLSKAHSLGKKDGLVKIDGQAATNNAVRCWIDKPPPKVSVYESRGLRSL